MIYATTVMCTHTQVAKGKPDPEIFLKAAETFKPDLHGQVPQPQSCLVSKRTHSPIPYLAGKLQVHKSYYVCHLRSYQCFHTTGCCYVR